MNLQQQEWFRRAGLLSEATSRTVIDTALNKGRALDQFRDGTPLGFSKSEKKVILSVSKLFKIRNLPIEQNDGSYILMPPDREQELKRFVLFKETLADDDDFVHYVLASFIQRPGDTTKTVLGRKNSVDMVPDGPGTDNPTELNLFLRKKLK